MLFWGLVLLAMGLVNGSGAMSCRGICLCTRLLVGFEDYGPDATHSVAISSKDSVKDYTFPLTVLRLA